MEKIIIDAEEGIFGRICSYAAKRALEGDEVIIVNSNKAVITGDKRYIIGKMNKLRSKGGHSLKGPKIQKTPFAILKRGVRGMLPSHKEGMGREAFKRVKCYNTIPEEFKGSKMIKIPGPNHDKFITLKEACEKI